MKQGFTLLELMVTVAIIGTVAAAGFPGLATILDNNRVVSNVNSFIGTLNFARSEAIKRNSTITITATNSATSDEWGDGWVIADGATTLKTYRELDGSTLNSDGDLAQLSFNSRGFLNSADNLTLCNDDGNNCTSIAVFITGHARVNEGTCP